MDWTCSTYQGAKDEYYILIGKSEGEVPAGKPRWGYEGYPKVSGLAAWSENCKWYSSVPLGAVLSQCCESA